MSTNSRYRIIAILKKLVFTVIVLSGIWEYRPAFSDIRDPDRLPNIDSADNGEPSELFRVYICGLKN